MTEEDSVVLVFAAFCGLLNPRGGWLFLVLIVGGKILTAKGYL